MNLHMSGRCSKTCEERNRLIWAAAPSAASSASLLKVSRSTCTRLRVPKVSEALACKAVDASGSKQTSVRPGRSKARRSQPVEHPTSTITARSGSR